MVTHTVARALDVLGVQTEAVQRWRGLASV